MSTIHFVGGEKGGVGKSCVARLIAQYFIDKRIPFIVRDGDRSHAEMLRFYGDFSLPVDLESGDDADGIFEAAVELNQQVLVDLPSQSERLLERWIEESGLLTLAEQEDVPLVFWHVMDDGKNSVELLDNIVERYGDAPNVRFVVVKNLGRGIDFSLYDGSSQRQIADQHGAITLCLPELNRKVMNKIDRLNLSFWAAANLDKGKALTKMERQRVRVWLTRWYGELDKVAHLVGLQAAAAITPPPEDARDEESLVAAQVILAAP